MDRSTKYPDSYTDAEHDKALGRLAADIAKVGGWTVGPSRVRQSPCGVTVLKRDINDGNGDWLGELVSRADQPTKATQMDRLIAAAPDLLAELVALVEQYEAWRDLGDGAAEPPDTDSARAAIAKAQGGAA